MLSQNNRRSDRYRKNNPKIIAIAAAVLVLLQIFSAKVVRSSIITILVPVLAIALFFFMFWILGKAAVKAKAKEEVKTGRPADGYCNTCSDDFVYNNQNEYSENTAQQNFSRDKQRRIRQLDDFLKNGLIDKNEYLLLRSRYEKSN